MQSETKQTTRVLIVGGGPVGLTLAALLAKHGINVQIVEADDGYCTGSRAICMSRRSQEIMGWIGADAKMTSVGLPWTGGRSYWRDKEVLHFQMPNDATQRFAPMVNIQQYYVEQYAHEAMLDRGLKDGVLWNTKVLSVSPAKNCVQAKLEAADGSISTITADYVVACDGGKSTVRESLGLKLQGVQYDGKYVIVDIEQETKRPVERLAWFDPPSNPGSTILMHRQPGSVWRIDYQVRDDEDPAEAVKPDNVLPRVQSHLSMIGELEPWKPLWISIYNAKCLTLPNYRPPEGGGRVFFAGDAALRLATVDAKVSSLINPRQSTPIEYVGSPLNLTAGAGLPAPEAFLDKASGHGAQYLSELIGFEWLLLEFSNSANAPPLLGKLPSYVRHIRLTNLDSPQAWERFAAKEGVCVLIRPDGYIAGRWASASEVDLGDWL